MRGLDDQAPTVGIFSSGVPSMKVLNGHTSPQTAYVVDDYPFGFRLRCKIRYWLETKKGHGMRWMSQTTNPKAAGEVWNKPKGSTYSSFLAMYLDEKNHVQCIAVSANSPSTYFKFYASGAYDQLPGAQQELVNLIRDYSLKVNGDTNKRFDAIKGSLSRLIVDHPNATRDELKALVEADNKSRYYDGDFDDIYNCWIYARKTAHAQTPGDTGS